MEDFIKNNASRNAIKGYIEKILSTIYKDMANLNVNTQLSLISLVAKKFKLIGYHGILKNEGNELVLEKLQ